MAQHTLNNNEAGGSFRNKLNENFAELYHDKHTHDNAAVLNNFGEANGQPTYNDQPIEGRPGINGNTPYIGENGNWWISGADTGVAATSNGTNGGIPDAPADGNQYARQDNDWTKIEPARPFNRRGPFQLGNMYNINDVVGPESDSNEYIAIMDGLVLPPPSMGWDVFHSGGLPEITALIMMKHIYDPQEKMMDVFQYADDNAGFSPTITVNTDTAETYILDVTDKNGTLQTPNLRGQGVPIEGRIGVMEQLTINTILMTSMSSVATGMTGMVTGRNMWIDTLTDLSHINTEESSNYIFNPSARSISSINRIKTLLHFDGNFLDEIDRGNFTANGSVQINTSIAKFGNGSCYFPGTGNSYLSRNIGGLNFGVQDFTVHFWAYPLTPTVAYSMLLANAGNTFGFLPYDAQSGNNMALSSLSTRLINTGKKITFDAWSHFAIVRNNGEFTIYENGINIGRSSGQAAKTIDLSLLNIGSTEASMTNGQYKGYIDEFVIVNYALWTENFIPPSQPTDLKSGVVSPAIIKWKPVSSENITPTAGMVSDMSSAATHATYELSANGGAIWQQIPKGELTPVISNNLSGNIILKVQIDGGVIVAPAWTVFEQLKSS